MPNRLPRPTACHLRRLTTAAVLLLSTLALGACSSGDARSTSSEHITLAYLPSEEDPEGRMEAFEALGAYLGERLGVRVDVLKATSYAPTIEAMRAGKIDVIRAGGSFTYMIAHEKADAQAIVAVGTDAGPGLYRSGIVAHPGSGIESLEQLIERAGELDFAFVDPASTSGHLIPRSLLEREGLDPEADFARLVFTMNHTNSAMAILSGKVHAGAISMNTYDRLIEAGRMDPDDVVVLWSSDPIPTGPVMVRRDLPEHLKTGIREAYLALNDSAHPVYAAMQEVYKHEDLRFFAAEDSDWDGLRRIAWNLDSIQLLSER